MTLLRPRSAISPLAAAIVTAVSADSALGALLAGDKIYNTTAPVGSPFPYLVFGLTQENPNNMFSAQGVETFQTIDIWTRKAATVGSTAAIGADQLWAIYDALYGLLHGATLTMTNFRTVVGTMTMLATMVDPDGESLHGIARYDVISRQTA